MRKAAAEQAQISRMKGFGMIADHAHAAAGFDLHNLHFRMKMVWRREDFTFVPVSAEGLVSPGGNLFADCLNVLFVSEKSGLCKKVLVFACHPIDPVGDFPLELTDD